MVNVNLKTIIAAESCDKSYVKIVVVGKPTTPVLQRINNIYTA